MDSSVVSLLHQIKEGVTEQNGDILPGDLLCGKRPRTNKPLMGALLPWIVKGIGL